MLSATATALGKPSDFMTFSPQPAGEKNAQAMAPLEIKKSIIHR
jgi:hypothetical protein